MVLNPWKSAVGALVYISVVVSVITLIGKLVEKDTPFIAPIAFLSLFTLSTAVMGYLFLKEPFEKYFSGDKEGAVKHFLKTVGIFAVFTVIVFLAVFFLSR